MWFGRVIRRVMYNITTTRIGKHFPVDTNVGYIKEYKVICFSFNHTRTDLTISRLRYIDITRHIFIEH